MKSLPDEFDFHALPGALAEGWGFDVDTAEHAAVGFGSYHWMVTNAEGTRGFATIDDLDRKPWLGVNLPSAMRRVPGGLSAMGGRE